jgi:Flp pilus assembly pilin Flp
MTRVLTDFIADEAGVDMVEYALLAGLLIVACSAAFTGIPKELGEIFQTLEKVLDFGR